MLRRRMITCGATRRGHSHAEPETGNRCRRAGRCGGEPAGFNAGTRRHQLELKTTATNICTWGAVGGVGNLTNQPIAWHANKAIYTWAAVRNNTGGTLRGAMFDYQIGAPSQRQTTAPIIWWHVQGGAWHHLTWKWYPAVKGGSDAFWLSNDATIGDLGPHASRNLQ
jgi:hypothetical protein